MSSLEAIAATWARLAWPMAWSAALCCALVLGLRHPLRRALGAESMPLLWLLVPLAPIAAALPHPATPIAAMPTVVLHLAAGGAWAPAPPPAGWRLPWPTLAMLGWTSGMLATGLATAFAQRRYDRRLRTARRIDQFAARYPVWRAGDGDTGPAMVGAWRPRIVIPADFERRYSAAEQALILAHEQIHARRRDGLWRLLAQGFVAVFWFNPLAWIAMACFRQDQELACDAAVLREHGGPRREYASAMLKTQPSSLPLPWGCSWTSRHPLTERVAMLKLPVPRRTRRALAPTVLGAIVLAGSLGTYAAQSGPAPHHPSAAAVDEAMVLFDGARAAATAYWSDHRFVLPDDNAAARLPDAALIAGKYVGSVVLDRGRLTATLKESAGGGHVSLVPLPDADGKQLGWRCQSMDIPAIAQLHRGCVYAPVPAVIGDGADGRHGLVLTVTAGGQPPRPPRTVCLGGPQDAYRFVDGDDKALPPWTGRLTVVDGPQGQVEVRAQLSGGSLDGVKKPAIRMQPGQQASIEVGQAVAGGDHTLRLDVAAWSGCGRRPAVVDDGQVHARFAGPDARALAAGFAARAGLTLVDPQALADTRPVAGNFEGVPAREALRLIGAAVDMKPVYAGTTVRFVAR